MAYFFSHGYGVSSEIGHIFWSGVMALKITKSLIRKKRKETISHLRDMTRSKRFLRFFTFFYRPYAASASTCPFWEARKSASTSRMRLSNLPPSNASLAKAYPIPRTRPAGVTSSYHSTSCSPRGCRRPPATSFGVTCPANEVLTNRQLYIHKRNILVL